MAMLADVYHRQSLLVPAAFHRSTSQTASLRLASGDFALYCSRFPIEQRRSFFGWGRWHGPDWHSGIEARYRRAIDKANRMFSRHARTIRHRPDWYRSPFLHHHYWKSSGQWKRLRRSLDDRDDAQSSGKWEDPWIAKHDAELKRMEEEFEKLKRAIDEDPYGMIFGRRLQPFSFGQKKGTWSTFLHDVFGFDGPSSTPSKEEPISVKPIRITRDQSPDTPVQADNTSSSNQEIPLRFDPISGRMVPQEPQETPSQSSKPTIDPRNTRVRTNSSVDSTSNTSWSASRNNMDADSVKGLNESQESRSVKEKGASGIDQASLSRQIDDSSSWELKDDTLVFTGAPRQMQPASTVSSNASKPIETNPDKAQTEEFPPSTAHSPGHGFDQTAESSSWTRASRNILGGLKDYITAKLDVEPESLDTRRWPFLLRKDPSTKANLRDEPLEPRLYSTYRQDPEAEELEKLRASDIRASFQGQRLAQQSSEETPRFSEGVEDAVEEPVRLDDSGRYGFNRFTATESKPGQAPLTTRESAPLSDAGGVAKLTETDKSTVAAVISTDVGANLEDQSYRMGEETYENTRQRINRDRATSDLDKGVRSTHTEDGEKGLAGLSTDRLPVDTLDAVSQAALANKTAELAATAGSEEKYFLLPAQRESLDKLLGDIGEANAATSALLAEIRDKARGRDVEEQPGKPESAVNPTLETTTRSYYKVLAYDVQSGAVEEATMTSGSSVPYEQRHPVDAISSVDHPAKLLPYISKMEAQGFELFSGGREVLVFKKTGESSLATPEEIDHNDPIHSPALAARLEQESIEQVESIKSQAQSQRTPSSSSPASKPLPPFFTGPQPDPSSKSSQERDESSHPFLRKVVRRMVLAGVMTGGTCYAIGVVAEYFRTGGQDGLGPRGFTGLEGR
ncbi:hypothetical protein VTO42DRAFT_4820 [Malbranchea cinnamomea]